MPKRRSYAISTVANEGSGAIGGNGSGMKPGIINNLVERVNERLREPEIIK